MTLIPKLSFKLTLSDEPLTSVLRAERGKLEAVARNAGATSKAFRQAFIAVHTGIAERKSLETLLTNKMQLRAYAVGIGGADFRRVPLSNEALARIDHLRPVPGRQLMENLFDWYCTDYDEMDNFGSVRDWLRKAIKCREEFGRWLPALSDDAPHLLAKEARDNELSLPEQLKQMGLERLQTGRLHSIAQNIYYLESLKSLEPNEESPLLGQLVVPEVYESPFTPEVPLGVEVMRILIERVPENGELGDSWRAVINAIGGDPRIPDGSKTYRRWWRPLGPELIEKARGWFSRMDLKIFLRVIEEHGRASHDPALQRMFPARKRFLEGLFDHGFVKGSRLYLSRGAARYVRHHINKEDLPAYSTVADQDKSIIYLNLGDVHLVEGSHNCKLWLHRKLPHNNVLNNYSVSIPSYYDLTRGIASGQHTAITHTPNRWITNAISAMQSYGIAVMAEHVMDKKDAKAHIRTYGY
ncbi:EH signature domain-containing protein [Ferrimonas balearica]|uniref:EH signature domain-containing protein n=1 Tax=Ferrimonas balearica TaxID=44012 RepID=UPI001C99E9D2|nr:EH signature domain-containing protein [Ferrimonas balearica]MBY5990509.1 hypothetical protein [Ferrimonas balearica]